MGPNDPWRYVLSKPADFLRSLPEAALRPAGRSVFRATEEVPPLFFSFLGALGRAADVDGGEDDHGGHEDGVEELADELTPGLAEEFVEEAVFQARVATRPW